jgi:hypothetical protein
MILQCRRGPGRCGEGKGGGVAQAYTWVAVALAPIMAGARAVDLGRGVWLIASVVAQVAHNSVHVASRIDDCINENLIVVCGISVDYEVVSEDQGAVARIVAAGLLGELSQ